MLYRRSTCLHFLQLEVVCGWDGKYGLGAWPRAIIPCYSVLSARPGTNSPPPPPPPTNYGSHNSATGDKGGQLWQPQSVRGGGGGGGTSLTLMP